MFGYILIKKDDYCTLKNRLETSTDDLAKSQKEYIKERNHSHELMNRIKQLQKYCPHTQKNIGMDGIIPGNPASGHVRTTTCALCGRLIEKYDTYCNKPIKIDADADAVSLML